ncbi:MAG: transporter [Candidatus Sulfotelmatobacter sp.]
MQRTWPGGGAHRSDLSGGLRFGVTRKLDFHWYATDFLSLADASGNRRGFGDNWFGLKYRFLTQTKQRPSLGVLYTVKAPSGELAVGSSGKMDHAFAFLVSKDVKSFHFDFNLIPQLVGQPAGNGFHNLGLAWATWLPITKRWTLVAEPYGFTALNAATTGFASVMGGFSLQVHPRLYLDAGLDVGASHFAPRKRVYGGVTFAAANLYKWLGPQAR